MEFIDKHPWREKILAPLPPKTAGSMIDPDNLDWDYIDTIVPKIGTISHEEVDIKVVQQKALQLFEKETKDMRLMAHFLYTLQHSIEATNILLAAALYSEYIEAFWDIAAPQKMKSRIASMVLKRFSNSRTYFEQSASDEEGIAIAVQFTRLKEFWKGKQDDLAEQVEPLITSFVKISTTTGSSSKPSQVKNSETAATAETASQPSGKEKSSSDLSSAQTQSHAAAKPVKTMKIPEVALDQTSERAWKHTLIKIADIEASRLYTNSISFQLRRHAVWFTVNGAPPADASGLTAIPPFLIDKSREYKAEMNTPTLELWKKIEGNIALSPFWFEGHYLSSQLAIKLGHPVIASIIKNELTYFIQRFPECKNLLFSDGSPFMDEAIQKWLEPSESSVNSVDNNEILKIFKEQGLKQALEYLEQSDQAEPRARFYAQIMIAQLLLTSGLTGLAEQLLENLQSKASLLTVEEWEPSFFKKSKPLKKVRRKE